MVRITWYGPFKVCKVPLSTLWEQQGNVATRDPLVCEGDDGCVAHTGSFGAEGYIPLLLWQIGMKFPVFALDAVHIQ